eukprot:gene18966-20872_t
MPTRYSFTEPQLKPNDQFSSTANIIGGSTASLDSVKVAPGCIPTNKIRATVKKQVGLLDGIALVIGTMIGSGIFASASTVANRSGSVGMMLITWTGCGVLALFGALSYVELGTAIPVSGGEHTYLRKGFGPMVAFMFSWVSVVVLKPSSISAICLACGNYISEAFLANFDCDPDRKEHIAKVIASFAIVTVSSGIFDLKPEESNKTSDHFFRS